MTASAVGVFLAAPAAGQAVGGRVLEAATEQALAGAFVRLLDGTPLPVDSGITDSLGQFLLHARTRGLHTIDVRHIGYRAVHSDPFDLPAYRTVQVEVRMDRAVLLLQPLVVVGIRRDASQERSYEGLYARRARARAIGPYRVILHSDPEFSWGGTVEEFLRLFAPARCQPTIFWNGFLVRRALWKPELLKTMVADLEGVEYYRDWASAPMPYREEFQKPGQISRCGILALWIRRSP